MSCSKTTVTLPTTSREVIPPAQALRLAACVSRPVSTTQPGRWWNRPARSHQTPKFVRPLGHRLQQAGWLNCGRRTGLDSSPLQATGPAVGQAQADPTTQIPDRTSALAIGLPGDSILVIVHRFALDRSLRQPFASAR